MYFGITLRKITLRKINYPSIILEQNKLITYKWLKLKEYQQFQTIVEMICVNYQMLSVNFGSFLVGNKNKFKYELHKFLINLWLLFRLGLESQISCHSQHPPEKRMIEV